MKRFVCLLFAFFLGAAGAAAQNTRNFSGVVLTQQFELVPNVSIEARTSDGKLQTVTDAEGRFELKVPDEPLSVKFFGKNLNAVTRIFAPAEKWENLQIKISYVVPPVNADVTI